MSATIAVQEGPGSGADDARRDPTAALAPLTGHRPDVQVLRGVAVLLVVLYHARVVVPGGFVGVDVFFVISGFVIGRILVARLGATDGVAFRSFFDRRVRRLLPALAVTLSVVVLAAPLLAPIGAERVTTATAGAAALSVANLYLWATTSAGYFAADAEWNPLLHTWSLSLEEQFYLVVPFLLALVWRLGRRRASPLRWLRLVVAVLFAGSFAWCVAATSSGPAGMRLAFYWPFTRAWEFAAGLALVLLPAGWTGGVWARRGSAVLGAALIAYAAFSFSGTTVFPGVAATVPVLGTVLVLWAGTAAGRSTVTSRPARPLAVLGDLSYGWYLWHWPLIVFAAAFWPTAGRLPLVVAAAVSLLPAWVSTRWIDGRRWTGVPSVRRSTVALVAVCIAAPLGASMLSARLATTIDQRPAVAAARAPTDHVGMRNGCNDRVPLQERDEPGCTWGDPGSGASVVLVGDSNADHFSETLVGAAADTGSHLRVATTAGCPMADVVVDAAWFDDDGATCRAQVVGTVEALVSSPPDVVVIANATDKYLASEEVVLVDPGTGARAVSRADRGRLVEQGLRRVVERLVAAGSEVVVIEVVPKPVWAGVDLEVDRCSALLLLVGPQRCAVPAFDVAEQTIAAQRLERRAARSGGARTWDFGAELCPEQRCDPSPGAAPSWIEPEHISVAAAESLVPVAGASLGGLLRG